MGTKKNEKSVEMEILEVTMQELEVNIVGMSPMIFNCMSQKVKQELLLPAKKKTKAEKETTLKHDPIAEFRSSVYRQKGDDVDTRLVFPGGGVKAALAQAGVDVPGAARATLGRLAHVIEWNVPVWGEPLLHMAVVRQAGQSRAPDVRTRAILPRWAMRFSVRFVTPNLTQEIIGNLLAAAGMLVGVGDFRPEKGKGSYGQFRLANNDDPELLEILALGREVQDAALESATPFDHEAEQLLEWCIAEQLRRGFKVAS